MSAPRARAAATEPLRLGVVAGEHSGDQLVLTAQLQRTLKGIWRYSTAASVGEHEVAHAEMMVAPEASR